MVGTGSQLLGQAAGRALGELALEGMAACIPRAGTNRRLAFAKLTKARRSLVAHGNKVKWHNQMELGLTP